MIRAISSELPLSTTISCQSPRVCANTDSMVSLTYRSVRYALVRKLTKGAVLPSPPSRTWGIGYQPMPR